MYRVCKGCKETKPLDKFPLAGSGYRRHACNLCYYKRNTSQQRNKIRDWYTEFKKNLSCNDCGNSDFRVLDFDHLPGQEKLFNIADAVQRGWGKKTIEDEIKKCQVLCANCHRIRTYERSHSLEEKRYPDTVETTSSSLVGTTNE